VQSVPAVSATPMADAVPGNNGTVKIHEGAEEPQPQTRNQPHVCEFHVDAFGFDAEQVLDLTFLSWPPTGDRSQVRDGVLNTDATGAGRWPETGSVTLPDGHYRLVVDTGNGRPTQDKHKMFWVDCAAQPTSGGATNGEEDSTVPGSTLGGATGSQAGQSGQVDAAVAGDADTSADQPDEPGESGSAEQPADDGSEEVSAATVASKLASTGAGPLILLAAAAGVGLVVAGFVIRRRATRN
jgi:hypothetical protein